MLLIIDHLDSTIFYIYTNDSNQKIEYRGSIKYRSSIFYSSSEFLEKITDYIKKKSPNTNSNNKTKLSITDSFYYFKHSTGMS
jgi:peptide methionine sulfoxide reductase MsrA